MTIESWQTSVARWGDPVYHLALLTTGDREAAQSAAVAALSAAIAAPTTDLESKLYRALAQPRRRWRWPTRSTLPRSLKRIPSDDRLLLGLWLLRGVDGAGLRAVFTASPEAIVARLQPLVEHHLGADQDGTLDDTHLTLAAWLAYQLGFSAEPSAHARTCATCRAQQARWHEAVARLRETLRAVVRGQHLPITAVGAIEDALATPDADRDAWWRQRRVWLPALIGVIGLVLALVIVPGTTSDTGTAAPLSAQALVQATLDEWAAPPEDGTLRRQVWARDPYLHGGEPVITDLWLPADGSAHRVEVRRNDALVEWQVADGDGRLLYGAEPADTSCRWNTGWSGNFPMFERAALRFDITGEQAAAVLEARVRQGAYGAGYVALQDALEAEDLRSFGARIENERALMVVGYTDTRTDTPRQIVLRIDPQQRQLVGVQEIVQAANQAQTRDLWRLEVSEQTNTLPTNQPSWGRVQQQTLIDPACPALKSDQIVSLRGVTNSPGRWYVASSLPPRMSGAAFTLPRGAAMGGPPQRFGGGNIVYVGPGRFLSLSASDWRGDQPGDDAVAVDGWQVEFRSQTGRLNGVIRPQTGVATQPLPSIEFWAGGMSRDEMLEIVATLIPLNGATWAGVNNHFLDPAPLPSPILAVVNQAIAALAAPRDGILHSVIETTVRTERDPTDPPDPYHPPVEIRRPSTLIETQTQRYEDAQIAQSRTERVLPDGTVYDIWQDTGDRFAWYNAPAGMVYTGLTSYLPPHFQAQPPQLDLLTGMLSRPEPITMSGAEVPWLLLQTVPSDQMSFETDFGRPQLPHMPFIADLPPGEYVQRLWLDQETALPQRLDVIHRNRQGREVLIRSITARNYASPASPPTDLSTLPVPANDMMLWRITSDGGAEQINNARPLDRTLAWSAVEGLTLVDDQNSESQDRQPPGANSLPLSSWDRIEIGEYGRSRLYEVAQGGSVRVTHGPAGLMRHILRYQVHNSESFGSIAWERSQPVRVTIDGELRDGWLLQNREQGALVVEINDTLLHISGPSDLLNGTFLDRLAELEWVNAESQP